MSYRNTYLFTKQSLHDYLHSQLEKAARNVEEIAENDFLRLSEDEIIDNLVSRYAIEKIELNTEHHEITTKDIEVDTADYPADYVSRPGRSILVPGLEVTLHIPFEGNEILFHMMGSTIVTNPPCADIQTKEHGRGEVLIRREGPAQKEADYYQNDLLAEERKIADCIRNQAPQIDKYNGIDLPQVIGNAIRARSGRIDHKQKVINDFKIPLRQKRGSPSLPIKLKRKIPKRIPKHVSKIKTMSGKERQKPEPYISSNEYNEILSLIRHQCRTFEGAPASFSKLSEESLRDVILSALNAIYEGDATGESFRRSGKTDIRIEAGDRAAFVAECKIWRGKKEFQAAVDQLMGYLTWRDSKTALIALNKKTRKFSDVLKEIPSICREKSQFIRITNTEFEGEWDVVFHHADDPNRTFNCRLMLFNIYFERKK